jgi:hypothetical protein
LSVRTMTPRRRHRDGVASRECGYDGGTSMLVIGNKSNK